MGKLIGIDLGTTFCCMAYINSNGQPEVIPNSEGDRITPSAVLFEGNNAIVGKEAKGQSFFEPDDFEQFVKRHMGERDYFFVNSSNKRYTPEDISGIILSKLKKDAEKYLDDTVEGAVITVPAFFNDAQRQSTIDAGKISGLNVLAIINEPTAAAYAFGIGKNLDKEQKVMVYDLGGGTFDVTIMQFKRDDIRVLSTMGNRKLGGYDFDQKIIDTVIDAAKEKGIDIEADTIARQELQLKAEEAKKTLSAKETANIMLNVGGKPFKYKLTRDEFNDMIEPLLYKTITCMEDACEEAGLEYSNLDKILLVGGSTRMPIVADFIRDETGITPSSDVHPDEAVAIGAAYSVVEEAKRINKNDTAKSTEKILTADIPELDNHIKFTDVTSHGIGILIANEYGGMENSVILPKNTAVPAEYKNQYSTTVEYQNTLEIQVTQGEDTDIRYVQVIGTSTIPIAPRQYLVPLQVTISCDENSIIHVHVLDLDQRKDLGEIKIDRVANLSDEEIEKKQREVQTLDISGE